MLTYITAIVGVILGSGSLALGIFNYLRDRPKIRIHLQWNMQMVGGSFSQNEAQCGLITVTNTGRRPIYISHVCLILPKSYKNRLLLLVDSVPGRKLAEGVTMSRYQYDAVFWRKRRPPILGVLPIPLTDEVRKKLERNTGVLINKIIDDSPAFRANLLEGDAILSFAGEDVVSPSDFVQKISLHKGQKVDIGIWRNGESKIISVQLNSP
ncbi:MAG: PDZ domain-containing protein [Verrucomicrobiota bacterium]